MLWIAGSAEGGLYGWQAASVADAPEVCWAFGAHIGTIKAVAIDSANETLATGGADEYIRLFNLKTRKQIGELHQHKGSVTCLAFYSSSHLVCDSVLYLSLYRSIVVNVF